MTMISTTMTMKMMIGVHSVGPQHPHLQRLLVHSLRLKAAPPRHRLRAALLPALPWQPITEVQPHRVVGHRCVRKPPQRLQPPHVPAVPLERPVGLVQECVRVVPQNQPWLNQRSPFERHVVQQVLKHRLNRVCEKTRKTTTGSTSDTAPRTRKARRTATEPKQSRRRRSSTSFDDLFGADEKSDFDAAVAAAKERLIVGDSEQSVLARLQSEGWNVKQSKFILGQSKP